MALGARGDNVEKPELVVLVIARGADRQIRRQGHAFRAALGPDAFFDVHDEDHFELEALGFVGAHELDRVLCVRERVLVIYREIVGAVHIHELEHVAHQHRPALMIFAERAEERPQGREKSQIIRTGVIELFTAEVERAEGREHLVLFFLPF